MRYQSRNDFEDDLEETSAEFAGGDDEIEQAGGSRTAPTKTMKRKTLGRLIGAFKTVSSKQINQILNSPGIPVWQRNYYEHIIRSKPELNKIREYIVNNSLNWETNENFKN